MHHKLIFLALLMTVSCARRAELGEILGSSATEEDDTSAERQACLKQKHIWWDEEKRCVTPGSYCILKRDGSIWQDEKCLSLEHQCLLKGDGSQWYKNQCIPPDAICRAKESQGFEWRDGQCISPQSLCTNKGYGFRWEKGQCLSKNFFDFCGDHQAPASIKQTVSVLTRVGGKTSCLETWNWLKNQRELNLAFFANLTGGQQITDLTPLMGLGLIKLELANQAVQNLTPLVGLRSLEYLDLQNNGIRDLSGIENLLRLEFLSLGYNKVSDIAPLANLRQLKFLMLFDNRISDLGPLKNLPMVETLYLNGNVIYDVSALSSMLLLRELRLENNPIYTDISSRTPATCPRGARTSLTIDYFCRNVAR